MKNKELFATIIVLGIFLLFGCESMDSNYVAYLENEKIYSPKVRNLRSYPALNKVSLAWDNPEGNMAKYILIDYEDDSITTETMIDTITISGLEIRGYTINVYTVDAFENRSIPVIVTAFPNGEE